MSCPDFRRGHMSRRKLLQIGALGPPCLSLSRRLEAEAKEPQRRATARSVILLFQFGGPSHLDSFDPKPDAPPEIRGEFATIPTALPGVRVSEHLPQLARLAGRYALVR